MEFPFVPQVQKSPRCKSKGRKAPKPVPRAEWTPTVNRIFLETCHELVMLGEGNQGILTKLGWKKLLASFQVKMKRIYDDGQMRNRFRTLKADYAFMKEVLNILTGAGINPITGALGQEEQWWAAKDAVTNGKAKAFRYLDLRPYRNMGPAVFEGNLATGEYSIAPSNYSNTFRQSGEDNNDSDPDNGEGSGDSGDYYPTPNPATFPASHMSGSGGSSEKRKRLVMANSSLVTGCRRRLAVTEMTGGSMQSTGQGKGKHVDTDCDGIPSIGACMKVIRDLKESDIVLHTYAVSLVEDPVKRQIMAGFSSTVARNAWLKSEKASKEAAMTK